MRTRELQTITDFVKAQGTEESPASLTISHDSGGNPTFNLNSTEGSETLDFAGFASKCKEKRTTRQPALV